MWHEEIDLDRIRELLKNHDLPYEDLVTSTVNFITLEDDGQLIGCIGLEQYGRDGLLRSFAVAPTHQHKGIGSKLLAQFLEAAKVAGIARLHLLTTTANHYFAKHGFQVTDRSQAPASISSTAEFASICPASAVYMIRDLSNGKRSILYPGQPDQ